MSVTRRTWRSVAVAVTLMLAALTSRIGAQSTALLQLDRLSPLASRAAETVDVTVDPAMLQLAAGMLSSEKSDEAAIKTLLAGLKGVYVKSFKFASEGGYSDADVEGVKSQLKAPWNRIVNVQIRNSRETVEVYAFQEGDRPGGLAIVVAQPKELTVVNFVGTIDLSQLGALRGKLGIPANLGLPGGAAPPKP